MVILAAAALAGCQREARDLGADPPLTAPIGAGDPRAARFVVNAYQIAAGGRLFGWLGCQACHGESVRGAADLADNRRAFGGSVASVYASIAKGRPGGMPSYDGKASPQEIWQLTAYVRDLRKNPSVQRRRQDLDQAGEAQGASWKGPLW